MSSQDRNGLPDGRMPWIRSLVFTLLVPCVVGVLFPSIIYRGRSTEGGLWETG